MFKTAAWLGLAWLDGEGDDKAMMWNQVQVYLQKW